jgi:hypothetical protein
LYFNRQIKLSEVVVTKRQLRKPRCQEDMAVAIAEDAVVEE